jgi:hypothetical protein
MSNIFGRILSIFAVKQHWASSLSKKLPRSKHRSFLESVQRDATSINSANKDFFKEELASLSSPSPRASTARHSDLSINKSPDPIKKHSRRGARGKSKISKYTT